MNLSPLPINRRLAAFTMVEIAICLAIIGVALVAIIGVLPVGMNVQRDNREETVINQDASVLLESIRSGERGGFDLTNYVYAITNYWVHFTNVNNTVLKQDNSGSDGFDYADKPTYTGTPALFTSPLNMLQLTNNANIIGVLSTPEFLTDFPAVTPTNNMWSGGFSNHIVAYVRAISGPSVEKPPQDNPLLVGNSFTYRIVVDNGPQAVDTNIFNLPLAQQSFSHELSANLHELRLSFYWPVQPNGSLGTGRQTQRTMIAGSIVQTNISFGLPLYYYQSQSFNNTP